MAKIKTELYSFILSRHSIRTFEPQPLNLEDQDRVKKILTTIIPLIPENEFIVISKNHSKDEDLVETLGAYGRFIIPPHYLIPYILGSQVPLVDLGYRIEQIAVHLWEMGIGCCYIGCLSREEKVRKLFELPVFSRIGASYSSKPNIFAVSFHLSKIQFLIRISSGKKSLVPGRA